MSNTLSKSKNILEKIEETLKMKKQPINILLKKWNFLRVTNPFWILLKLVSKLSISLPHTLNMYYIHMERIVLFSITLVRMRTREISFSFLQAHKLSHI